MSENKQTFCMFSYRVVCQFSDLEFLMRFFLSNFCKEKFIKKHLTLTF